MPAISMHSRHQALLTEPLQGITLPDRALVTLLRKRCYGTNTGENSCLSRVITLSLAIGLSNTIRAVPGCWPNDISVSRKRV